MKKIVYGVIVFLIASVTFAQHKTFIYDKLTRNGNEAFFHMPIGLCEDWPEESTTRQIYVNDFELLKKAGIKLLRISFGWDAIESEKDKYDWLFWDDLIKTGAEDYGITMVPYICYVPRWASSDPADSMLYWNKPPIDFEEFGQFTFDLVTRYKKWLKTWEIWNEPDISIYWSTQDVKEFARFHKIGAEAVRRADPEAKVVLGGIAYRPEWIKSLFKDHGVSPYVDIVNIHNYFETWHHNPVEAITDYIGDVHDVISEYGNNQPVWMAEVGYSTFRSGATVSDSYSSYYNYEHTPAYQAVDLVKRISLVLSTEKIAALAWYEIKDLPQSDEVIGDIYNNKHLGVAWADHSPKPALHAITFINKLFSSPMKSIDTEVIVNKSIGSDARLTTFMRENGDVIVVAWLQTHIPGRRDVFTGDAVDKRIEKIKLQIPYALSNKATLYNELGEGKEYSKINVDKNKTTLDEVELHGGKIVVIEIKK